MIFFLLFLSDKCTHKPHSVHIQASNTDGMVTEISVLEPFIQHRDQQNEQSRQHHTRLDTDSSVGVWGKDRGKYDLLLGDFKKTRHENAFSDNQLTFILHVNCCV